ncbi:MAG: hypothetical protein AAF654_08920 [Myxococcota bacterium]
MFDPQQAARTAAQLALDALLNPARLNRVSQQHQRDPNTLSLNELLSRTAKTAAGYAPVLDRYVAKILTLSGASPEITSAIEAQLPELKEMVTKSPALQVRIERFERRTVTSVRLSPKPAPIPPGSPIGAENCWHCDSIYVPETNAE